MRRAKQVADIWKKRNPYRVLVGKHTGVEYLAHDRDTNPGTVTNAKTFIF
jgi:hypothetical protein